MAKALVRGGRQWSAKGGPSSGDVSSSDRLPSGRGMIVHAFIMCMLRRYAGGGMSDKVAEARGLFVMQRRQSLHRGLLEDAPSEAFDTGQVFSAFRASLVEVTRVAQAFFVMAMAAVSGEKQRHLFVTHSIRIKADFMENGRAEDESAIRSEVERKVREDWAAWSDSEEFMVAIAEKLLNLSKEIPELVSETNVAILRQSAVMLWSACESLVREYFRIRLNDDPSLALAVFSDDEAKKFWSSRDFSLEAVERVGFSLQRCMGDLLLEINSMISLKAMKAGLRVVTANNCEVMKALKSEDTHWLFQLRNLVAHRNGVVDEHFLMESRHIGKVGDRLVLAPTDFEKMYSAAKTVALALFDYERKRMGDNEGAASANR